MAIKGNARDFMSILGRGFTDDTLYCYADVSPHKILCRRFRIDGYVHSYDHAIVAYHKACGCEIMQWNHNLWDDCFYLYYTKPTKAVEPASWYTDVYRQDRLVSSGEKFLKCMLIVVFILAVITVIIQKSA